MNWMVRMTAELEVSMNSVERVVEYEPMDAEAPAVIEGHRPPPGWPSLGAIGVEGLVVRYRPELPPVIDGLTFATKAKEKVRAVLSAKTVELQWCCDGDCGIAGTGEGVQNATGMQGCCTCQGCTNNVYAWTNGGRQSSHRLLKQGMLLQKSLCILGNLL